MLTTIHGIALANGTVSIFNDADEIVATCKADASGHYAADTVLSVGQHRLRAECSLSNGIVRASQALDYEVREHAAVDAHDGGENNQGGELSPADRAELEAYRAEQQAAARQRRAESESQYVELVEAVAMGFDINLELGGEVLAACEKTVAKFAADVELLSDLLQKQKFDAMVHEIQTDEIRRRHTDRVA